MRAHQEWLAELPKHYRHWPPRSLCGHCAACASCVSLRLPVSAALDDAVRSFMARERLSAFKDSACLPCYVFPSCLQCPLEERRLPYKLSCVKHFCLSKTTGDAGPFNCLMSSPSFLASTASLMTPDVTRRNLQVSREFDFWLSPKKVERCCGITKVDYRPEQYVQLYFLL